MKAYGMTEFGALGGWYCCPGHNPEIKKGGRPRASGATKKALFRLVKRAARRAGKAEIRAERD